MKNSLAGFIGLIVAFAIGYVVGAGILAFLEIIGINF